MKMVMVYAGIASLSFNLYAEESLNNLAVTSTPQPMIVQPFNPTIVNCSLHIPAENRQIDNALLNKWASFAAIQSFTFDSKIIDKQLIILKNCYTEEGWKSFNEALEHSGNLQAIKTQHLIVKSKLTGSVSLDPLKGNQWKAKVPLEVIYQSNKEKLTQALLVNLVIGRKLSGDLGIMQIIAEPYNTKPVPH